MLFEKHAQTGAYKAFLKGVNKFTGGQGSKYISQTRKYMKGKGIGTEEISKAFTKFKGSDLGKKLGKTFSGKGALFGAGAAAMGGLGALGAKVYKARKIKAVKNKAMWGAGGAVGGVAISKILD